MAALTNDRMTARKEGVSLPFAVAAGVKIFAGALVCANAAGFAVPGATAATLVYLGRAEEPVDNTAGDDGDAWVVVRRKEAFLWENDALDPVLQASVGRPCYVVDDQTVAAGHDSNARSLAGLVVGVEPSGVWVE